MTSASFSKYRLIAELGHGGMADVFLAVQAGPAGSGFSKLTVIKRLRANLSEEPEFIAMLVDEARISARLNHPNVVQTNEVGSVDNQYYIAMEYLDGQPLHRVQHRAMQRAKDGAESPLAKEVQYVILMDALAGLHHAHELADYDGTALEIVHRDVTPHNIFVTYAGQVKVVDFGIAKASGRASETRQGVVKGKVRYMAPEQAIAHDVDRRTDVFAAGVMLWEMILGRRMWRDMDDLRIVHELVGGKIPGSPREFDETVPEELDRICKKALARKPEDRYQTAEEFRIDLEAYLADSRLLVEARKKLPQVISEMFQDKRTEIRKVIESQLAMLTARPSLNGVKPPVIPVESTPSSMTTPAPLSIPMDVPVTEGTVPYSEPSMTAVSPVRARVRMAAVAVAVVCIVGTLAWRATRPATSTQATAPEPSAAAAPAEIALSISGAPLGAAVRIDDGLAMTLPVTTNVPADNKEHTLSFQAEGFVTEKKVVKFVHDASISVALTRQEKPVAATAPSTTAHAPTAPAWRPPTAKTTPTVASAGKPPKPEATAQPAPTGTGTAAPTPSGRQAGRRPNRLSVDPNMPW